MLLSIEPDGPVPIYQQIRDRIVEAIARGGQPAGSALPSTRQLAIDLGVNFHTVNKGYDLLRQEGLLRLGRKSGAVVRRDAGSGPPDPAWAQDWAGRLRTLLAEAAAQGMPATGIVGECQAAMADFAFPAAPTETGNRSASPP
jgi:GntR family transcriptional regulator